MGVAVEQMAVKSTMLLNSMVTSSTFIGSTFSPGENKHTIDHLHGRGCGADGTEAHYYVTEQHRHVIVTSSTFIGSKLSPGEGEKQKQKTYHILMIVGLSTGL